jgi:HD superfamily phosphodiesterase
MIPSRNQVKALWEKYALPKEKQTHVTLVARVALFLAGEYKKKNPQCSINVDLLRAAALTHDIDKNAPKLPGEKHPDACVRILREELMGEVARIVKTHPLHTIVSPVHQPKTIEEKLLFLADKMVKYEIITVDRRFELWRNEDLPEEGKQLLTESYPLVKKLEKEILTSIGIQPDDVAKLA